MTQYIFDEHFTFSRRILKEEICPVMSEWRFSRGFDKGSIQVISQPFFKTDIAPDLRCLWASSAFRHSTFPDFGIGCQPLLVTGSSLLSAEAVISLLLYSVSHHRDSTINSHCLALGIRPAGGRRRYNALLGQDPSCGPSSLMASYKHTAGPGAPTLGSIILALTPK